VYHIPYQHTVGHHAEHKDIIAIEYSASESMLRKLGIAADGGLLWKCSKTVSERVHPLNIAMGRFGVSFPTDVEIDAKDGVFGTFAQNYRE